MSEAQVSASSVIAAALSLERALEVYHRDKDRRSLVGALKEQLARYAAASQAENNRNIGLRILFNQMAHMPDDMLLETFKKLSEIGLDMAALTGVPMPATISIKQALGLPAGGPQSSLGGRTALNPKDTGLLLEAIEHAAHFFRDKAPLQIERSREGG
jgi:hypothetical protein